MKLSKQLAPLLEDEKLNSALSVFPKIRPVTKSKAERLIALMDVYKMYIPNETTVEMYNRMYLSVLCSLEKKNTLEEVKLLNDNYRSMKSISRHGVIGGLDAFKLTGNAGVGKTSMIQRCIQIITHGRTIKTNDPQREIIPILEIETVSDCSIKNLLYSILIKVDEKLGTNYYSANNSLQTTTDSLLAAVSNVLTNHVCLLCIDEIERIVENKKGIVLLNYLTQLINQSNVCICFVGTDPVNKFFEMKEYLARRMIGISAKGMNYDEEFYSFCQHLFEYQYTDEKANLNGELVRWFYDHSNGLPSMLVSLFVETQKNIIISGEQKLTIEALNRTYKTHFTTMANYIGAKVPKSKTRQSPSNKEVKVTLLPDKGIVQNSLFRDIAKQAKKDVGKAISLLSTNISVEFL